MGDGSYQSIVHLPIDGTLDLHTFRPEEAAELVCGYLEEAAARGLHQVTIIHGKGRGVLRRRVRSLLARHPLVLGFRDADHRSGGWGATVVRLGAGHISATDPGRGERSESEARRPTAREASFWFKFLAGLAAGAALAWLLVG
ncbi:Smr domain-containing protein [Desulfacinum hydrothermale DSM 13146]|uniref:Smr domain-containing protein n=1 Tax=Desulfacinum hydrothermale DSM 13146 TaxID=1121390 RepID=A0A1W1XU17_9BACT|nr:Smr/MutS family protein [Desulfacinum hydrothermale]SMC27387.1 Smr domain-containing protein [Desulfacinum hydrothermale DSM 13146]